MVTQSKSIDKETGARRVSEKFDKIFSLCYNPRQLTEGNFTRGHFSVFGNLAVIEKKIISLLFSHHLQGSAD